MENPDILIAKEQLKKNRIVIAIIKDGEILFTSSKNGIQPFFDALAVLPRESFAGCSIADKVVGKAALMLAAYIKAKDVYTPLASQHAVDASINLNLNLIFDKRTAFIKNRSQDGMCPMEKTVLNVDNPEEAFEILTKTLDNLNNKS